MPMVYQSPEGTRKIELWYRTSKGTNYSRIITVPDYYSNDDIKEELENWSSHFYSDSYITIGWNEEIDFGHRSL